MENNEIVFSNYIDGYGTTPTEPSLIAMFTGLPINLISVNTINNKIIKNIFKNVYSLGKILADNGYNNVSLRGSNGNFSGTHQFLSEHGVKKNIGQFELMNRQYNPKYEHKWGYSDEDVFDVARDEITSLINENKPFFLLIHTIDTHSDDKPNVGAENKFNNVYYNNINNTSNQIYKFVKWMQNKSIYKDTTIIILGDHLRNSQMMKFPPQRKIYNLFINARHIPDNKKRTFTQIDLFPTILEALGAEIKGHKLGLGVSVFSDNKTLAEVYSRDELKNELSKKNKLYDRLIMNEYP